MNGGRTHGARWLRLRGLLHLIALFETCEADESGFLRVVFLG